MSDEYNLPFVISYDAYIDGEESETYLKVLNYNSYLDNPHVALIHKDFRQKLQNIIKKTLNKRELIILKHRYGFDNSNELSLQEIGTKIGVCAERVRQIDEEMQIKLRRQILPLLKEFRNNYIYKK